MGADEEELVVNFAYVKASTNAKIRDESPAHVAKRKDVSRPALESHRIDVAAFRRADWEKFKTRRAQALKHLILDACSG
jgi:hypothetical protein